MLHGYAWLLRWQLFFCLLLAGGVARAQAPAWTGVVPGNLTQPAGTSLVEATAVDDSGNLLVTGYFYGTVNFGGTQLVSALGNQDLFIGKWVPATGTWAWVQRGGGDGPDFGYGVAVSGSSIYVAVTATNNVANTYHVSFGPGNAQPGISSGGFTGTGGSSDLVLVKYVDNGSSASVAWSQIGGGIGTDYAYDVAVSGTSVYLTGYVNNDRANYSSVVFGGGGTTAGTATQLGATTTVSDDLVLAKYTDNGSTATFRWSQVGGGTGVDQGRRLAVSGTSVYVAGTLVNSRANAQAALFGGSGSTAGTAAQYGASTTSSVDQLLVKYTDNGSTGALGWTRVAGGSDADYASGVAASGTSVYVVGNIFNNRANANGVLLGGAGTAAGTVAQYGASATASNDLLLTKYTDGGSSAAVTWAQVAGGTDNDFGYSVAVSGTSVYVAGYASNDQANTKAVVFGGSGSTAGAATQVGVHLTPSADLLVARYTDTGSAATVNWSQVGGGETADTGYALAVSGASVYVGGYLAVNRLALFGTAAGSPIIGTGYIRAVLGRLDAGSGAWQSVTATGNGGISYATATTTDAAGNMLVIGTFYGQVAFGSTVLSCGADGDLFVAKYVPGTGTWAWAQSAGGRDLDEARGIAVSGSSIYLVGTVANTTGNVNAVGFGGTGPTTHTSTQLGASPTTTPYGSANDIFVAKYTDLGSSVSFGWSQVIGGTDNDYGYGVAVNGNQVYVSGTITNNLANANAVVLGGSGTTLGTTAQPGATSTLSEDLLLVKYVDNGASATVAWTQVAGGTSYDGGRGVAVSGANVYVTGYQYNSTSNGKAVVFGGSGSTAGTVPQYGAGPTNNQDILVAKYVDQGSSASLGWTQVAGGISTSAGTAIVAAGNAVYVTGTLSGYTASTGRSVFGGSGATPGTVLQAGATASNTQDIFVAKYLDNGASATVAWTQVAGGTDADRAQGLAVRNGAVYVAGTINNTVANGKQVVFGGTGTTPGTVARPGVATYASDDIVVARYTDQGSSAAFDWAQVAGGGSNDGATGVAVSGSGLYVVGYTRLPAIFGAYTLSGPVDAAWAFVGSFGSAALPVRAASGQPVLGLYPNPAPAASTLTGAQPGAVVQVLDALGRVVAAATADAAGTARLSGLAPGLYLVRTGTGTARLAVE